MTRVEIWIASEPGAGTTAWPLDVADIWETIGSANVMAEESVDSEA
jgi:hypothetical protein